MSDHDSDVVARRSDAAVALPLPAAIGPRAFWVAPPRFLAGAYPGDADLAAHTAKIDALLALSITHVVTLMEEHEVGHGGAAFTPYAPALERAGVIVQRHAIRDVSTPVVELVTTILDTIDVDLAAGGNVYLHCWGGRGRTGVIVGCWLVRHGWVAPQDARRELARLRADCADAAIPAPDTADQLQRITSWKQDQ
jgi:protein-tyrosine phosphatase